ncbi:beta-N-acetylhexosaminidase [Thalassotalea fonticola]|uniref:beta-N-acetylhexosaminidase n=1 Tax=Thalassotalea fonticola TaxID=3065649 RepID=A0ABZ0GLA3_9GAMM|nr:beta-N-acetylhexosaminidase [Colwelliaceae bacterium S1-1]
MKTMINKVFLIFLIWCNWSSAWALSEPSIIPRPAQLKMIKGNYQIPQQLLISSEPRFSNEVAYLSQLLSNHLTVISQTSNVAEKHAGIIISTSKKDLGNEGYRLQVDATGVKIQATTETGVFYGIQSLLQMLPATLLAENSTVEQLTLPYINITDTPRFSWRGFMLDEARHFQGKQEVKRLLEQMAQLKMNVFHWHLTDDQGWRIEIKKYPRLTEIGSKRSDTQLGGWNSKKRSGEVHEGFYTQDDIREIVAYADKRHITIVPEIGMPGHASAAVAAYPELGTGRRQIEVPVVFGKMVDSYNAADEKVYQILSDILDEVVALFPGQVIHIGGDEVRFDQWQESAEIKALMTREKLQTMADVQIYFTNRMSKIIEAKGRRMMGWNEIMGDDLHGFLKDGQTGKAAELSKSALVHFWKGNRELAENAIKKGHQVVNSWHMYTYLDYGYRTISMAKAYHFDPIFSGLEKKYHNKVEGLGCQMWGEWIPTVERMYKQVFPRLSACAEVGWTDLARKDFGGFQQRMKTQYQRWQIQGIPYADNNDKVLTAKDFFNQPLVANWTPAELTTGFNKLSWEVTEHVKKQGKINVAMLYREGKNALEIESLELYENGKRIAKDRHYALSGEILSNIVYKLKLPEYKSDATYTLKASVKGSLGIDSFGQVKMWQAD